MRTGSASGGGRRVAAIAVVLAFAILSAGFLLGQLTGERDPAAKRESPARERPSRARLAPPPAKMPPPLPPREQPVSGPNHPPLPAEQGGPFGSRFTTGTAEVALTFDDGPHPQWTPQVLTTLADYGVKATFCLVGAKAAAYPQLVRDIAAGGHTLCNHSWDHDMGLGNRDEQAMLADLERANAAIRAAVPGARISYFRQPGGFWSKRVVEAAHRLGMTSLHWRVDPQDWDTSPAYRIASDVNSQTVPGAIVLLHDGGGDRRSTLVALRTILPHLLTRLHLAALPPGRDAPRESESADSNARGDGNSWFAD